MLSEGEAAPARRPTPPRILQLQLAPPPASTPSAHAAATVLVGRGVTGRRRLPRVLQLQLASAGEHAERARCRHGVLVGRDVAGRRRRHERRQCRAKVARDGAVRATRDARADGVRRPDFLTEAPFEAAARL